MIIDEEMKYNLKAAIGVIIERIKVTEEDNKEYMDRGVESKEKGKAKNIKELLY